MNNSFQSPGEKCPACLKGKLAPVKGQSQLPNHSLTCNNCGADFDQHQTEGFMSK